VVSKYQCFEQRSARLQNGLFWLSLLAWSLALVAAWRTWSSQLYAAFQALPAVDQFVGVAAASLFCFGFAATVREFRTDFAERWAARIVGACGVLMLLSFSFRMTMQVDRLEHQIAVKGSHETSAPLAQQIVDMVAQKTVTVETPSGRTVSWHGGAGPMSVAARRIGGGAIRYRSSADFVGSEDRRSGSVSAAPSRPKSALSEF
jgi:hypothetical protein